MYLSQYVLVFLLVLGIGIGITVLKVLRPLEEGASPSWSPDGRYLAYECFIDGPTREIAEYNGFHYTAEAADICTINAQGKDRVRLTKDAGAEHHPVWAPHGTQIAYTHGDGIYVVDADGSNQRRLVQSSDVMGVGREVAWSPDGAYLLFSARTAESRWDIFTVNVQNNAVTILTQGRDTNDFSPVWTLNGRRVVFLSGTGALAAPARLSVVDPDGNNRQVIDDGEKFYKYISASNDGNIAFAIDDPFGDDFLYRMDLDRKETVKVGPYSVGYVSWSPNGEYLAYGWGTIEILEVATGDIREVAVGHIDGPLVWSSDSRYLAVTGQESIGGFYYAKRILAIDSTNGTVSQLVPYK